MWIPSVSPLVGRIPSHDNLEMDCLLRDMVTKDSRWNLDLFQLWPSEDRSFSTLAIGGYYSEDCGDSSLELISRGWIELYGLVLQQVLSHLKVPIGSFVRRHAI